MTQGVLYIASGSEYISQATESARSVKEAMDVPITLVSDRDIIKGCFDTVLCADDFCYHYGDSVLQIPELPYEKTLLLDTDIIINESVSELFEMTEKFDIAAATIADGRFTLSEKVPESFPEYNTGVVVFNKNRQTSEFIKEWKRVYREYLDDGIRMNQPSFRETLYRSSLRVATIPTEYNCRANFGGYLNSRVKILHGMFEEPESIFQILNEYEGPRTFFSSGDGVRTERIDTTSNRVTF
jgi:hypothetical protein